MSAFRYGYLTVCAHVVFAGESVPSIVVLWVMRDLPPRSCDSGMNGRVTIQEVLIEDALVPDSNYLSQLLSSAAGRRHLLLPNCCNSDVSPSWTEVNCLIFVQSEVFPHTVCSTMPPISRKLWIHATVVENPPPKSKPKSLTTLQLAQFTLETVVNRVTIDMVKFSGMEGFLWVNECFWHTFFLLVQAKPAELLQVPNHHIFMWSLWHQSKFLHKLQKLQQSSLCCVSGNVIQRVAHEMLLTPQQAGSGSEGTTEIPVQRYRVKESALLLMNPTVRFEEVEV